MNYKYPREEKLKQKNDISLLFEKGKWKTCGNLRVISYQTDASTSLSMTAQHKVGVSVSKRYFKKAVDRNRAKRFLREAYRLHKTDFLEKFGKNSLSMIFYISQEKPKHFKEIEKDFLKLLKK